VLAAGLVVVAVCVAVWPWFGQRMMGLVDGAFCDDQRCPPDAAWTLPDDVAVTSGFRTDARPDHHGVDLATGRGAPVVAASAGVVVTAECQARRDGERYGCDRDGSAEVLGCGWFVKILHAHRIATLYCHLDQEPEVSAGDVVTTGQLLGYVGSTGNSSEPHLHFEVQRGDGLRPPRPDSALDPQRFLSDRGIAPA
jgi:murein DD-endopeptidase MepM/ murein hydrolase activator NlpD